MTLGYSNQSNLDRPPLYFRAEANHQIGLGHLTRCFSLAKMIESEFTPIFITKETPDSLLDLFKESSFPIIKISEGSEEGRDEINHLKTIMKPLSTIVLDGYNFTSNFQKQIKDQGFNLICIDDNAEKEFFADLIINPNIHAPELHYVSQPYTKLALGTDYVMLRPEFFQGKHSDNFLSEAPEADELKKLKELKRILICMGGADPTNQTLQMAEIIASHPFPFEIDIIIGSAFRNTTQLISWKNSLSSLNSIAGKKINIFQNIKASEMMERMSANDLLVIPASSIFWESCIIGKPVMTGFIADNQKQNAYYIEKSGAAVNVGDFSLCQQEKIFEKLDYLRTQSDYRNSIAKVQRKLVDGHSPYRMQQLFSKFLVEY